MSGIPKREEKVSASQKECLILFMDAHKDFARNKLMGVEGKMQSHKLWGNLCAELNQLGATKSVIKWQRVWTDLKVKTKRKAAGIANSRRKTGGGLEEPIVLTDLEEKIVSILSKESIFGVDGPDGLNMDSEAPSILEAPFENETLFTPSTAKKCVPFGVTKNRAAKSFISENQINNSRTPVTEQIEMFEDTSTRSSDSNIETSDSELNSYSRVQSKKRNVTVKAVEDFTTMFLNTNDLLQNLGNNIESLNSNIESMKNQNNLFQQQKEKTNELLERIALALEGQSV